ncbi:RNA-directed DNA polymerase, eukaryota, reverse transcriptase zinc-binding domain protein [Tanacetum coccineum]
MYSIASCNIRGLNRTPKQTEVCQVINDNLLNVCAILESHVDIGKLERVCNKVFVKWKWASNSRFCTKGSRIIIGWNDNVVDVVVLSCTSQAIHTQVMHKADSKVMFCTFVYASNSYETRREFWYSLEMHKQFVNTRPWVIMGDFNAALFIEDTFHGSNDINISMRDFNDRVNKIEIADVNSIGLHGIRRQKEKLVSKNKPKPFKFFNLLAYKPDFMQLVTEHWKMEFKLFNLIRHELDEVQMALDNDPSSIILREEEAVYLTDFTQATLDEERFLKQKSKIEWLQVEILILRIFTSRLNRGILIEALDEFKRVWGLVPSIPQSTIFICNVLDHVKNDILQLMPFERGTLPIKYLGVPLISSRLLYKDCKILIERVHKRITDWKNKWLSFAGRRQLVIAVLSSMYHT